MHILEELTKMELEFELKKQINRSLPEYLIMEVYRKGLIVGILYLKGDPYTKLQLKEMIIK